MQAAAGADADQTPGTILIDAPGYAPIVRAQGDEPTLEVEMHRAVPITGSCDGPTVRLDNPFQHLVTKVDEAGAFSFTGVIDVPSRFSCWSDATTEDDVWRYTYAEGFIEEDVNIYGGLFGSGCSDALVIDEAGRPIAGAEVSTIEDEGGGMSQGVDSASTNGAGIACVDGIRAFTRLVVDAPASDGGECAGRLETTLTREQAQHSPLVVRLRARALPALRARGRILGPEGLPVSRAWINVEAISPSSTPSCAAAANSEAIVETADDGTFTLPPYPRGTLTISVAHDWYVRTEIELANNGRPHDIVVKRKAR